MATKKATEKAVKDTAAKGKKPNTFSDVEKAAMKERSKELKSGKVDGDTTVREKIAEMEEPDRTMASRVHEIIRAAVPSLQPKLWYGMPSYATEGKDGKIVCFFQPATKFGTRYATLGFNDIAKLDDGGIWPVAYGIQELTPAVEEKISALVKKSVG